MKKQTIQWILDLYHEGMSDQDKYKKISQLYFMIHNRNYCDAMASELTSHHPSKQALWWQEVCQYQEEIEEELERLKKKIECYEGEMDEEGLPHGKGIKYDSSGMYYDGEWDHGKKNGFGIRYQEDGSINYEGNWENDQMHGYGILIDYRQVRYEGYFNHNQLSNVENSIITFPKGERVEGSKHIGYRCTYPNGDIFECESFTMLGRGLATPLAIGKGIYHYVDGSTLSGQWDYGKHCDGEFIHISVDGMKEIWKYKNDEVIEKIPYKN